MMAPKEQKQDPAVIMLGEVLTLFIVFVFVLVLTAKRFGLWEWLASLV